MSKHFCSLFLLLALLIRKCIGQDDWDCVSSCKCLWISGKKTAECKHQNFSEIPDFVSKQIQHLDLTGNNINQLPEKVFIRIKLENLQKLILRDCNIKIIHSEAFNGLRIVIEIDLSSNSIRQLHRGTFDQTERLRVLLLNQNRLQILDNYLFHDLTFLQKIELSDNDLIQIGQYTFQNVPGLQTLTLDGNRLSKLNINTFNRLPKLGSLELRKNPWNCDCRLRYFRDWAINHKLYTRPTSCEKPAALMDRMWDEISSEEFSCAPKIEQIGALQCGDSGIRNAHLWCRASAIPKPQITWIHKRQVLTNGTKRYDSKRAYVVHQNDEWANLTIFELLQSDKGEYVCIAKNFGGFVQKNVSLAILEEAIFNRGSVIGLPLVIAFVVIIVFILVVLTLCICYNWRRRSCRVLKHSEMASLDRLGLGEQEKSLITAINPVVKPPRRYETSSAISYNTEMMELDKNLINNDLAFANGVNSVNSTIPELDSILTHASGATNSFVKAFDKVNESYEITKQDTFSENAISSQPYPPDLLAFSREHNLSTSNQTCTSFHTSRLSIQQSSIGSPFSLPPSPTKVGCIFTASASARFKTLPHSVRAHSVTPYTVKHQYSSMSKHAYGTLPRRLQATSCSSGSPTRLFEQEIKELVYDNLGIRSTADGSSILSLDKKLRLSTSMHEKLLPVKPIKTISLSPMTSNSLSLSDVQNSTLYSIQQFNSSAPEGALEWPMELVKQEQQCTTLPSTISSLLRKVPPRPPPKPIKARGNRPLYEDEGEDGTEV